MNNYNIAYTRRCRKKLKTFRVINDMIATVYPSQLPQPPLPQGTYRLRLFVIRHWRLQNSNCNWRPISSGSTEHSTPDLSRMRYTVAAAVIKGRYILPWHCAAACMGVFFAVCAKTSLLFRKYWPNSAKHQPVFRRFQLCALPLIFRLSLNKTHYSAVEVQMK